MIDELDVRLVRLLTAEPRIGVLEASRRLGVARGTVQARLTRMERDGVITGYGPQVDPAALGFGVTAFCSLQISQDPGHEAVSRHIAEIPDVLEAHTISGASDMLLRVVARNNADLQRVIDRITAHPAVMRVSTVVALHTQIPYRVLPLLRNAV